MARLDAYVEAAALALPLGSAERAALLLILDARFTPARHLDRFVIRIGDGSSSQTTQPYRHRNRIECVRDRERCSLIFPAVARG